ncbi:LysR family transcriptional regulator [Porticoccus sp.]|nr:MAG: LysR family transcriptional regulator [Gammaproteobacteria bacterium]
MDITIKQLKAFVTVAQTRNFAEAGERLHLSQPALSIALKNMEEVVGGKLLARTTRTLSLTPEGEAFLPVAQRLLADWDNALTDLHNLFAMRRGKLSIATMASFSISKLPKALHHYRDQFPDINITVQDVVAEEVIDMVRKGRVEVGVTFDLEESEDLHFEPLFEDSFFVVTPHDHPLLKQKTIRWAELQNYPFVTLQRPSAMRQMIDDTTDSCGIHLTVEFEAHQLASIGSMVANGLGISVVPSLAIQQMQLLGAESRPLTDPVVKRQVGILTRRRYPLSSAANALVETLKSQITAP